MSFKTVQSVLAADVGASGTFTVGYPSGTTGGNYKNGFEHRLVTLPANDVYSNVTHFTLTFNAANITVNLNSNFPTTLKAGTGYVLQIDKRGQNNFPVAVPAKVSRAVNAFVTLVDLGSPALAVVNNICAAQAIAGAVNAVINGALASNGAVTMDQPRNVQATSSNAGDTTQTVIFTGKDEYGVTMTEKLSLNGTSAVLGNKAFASVSQAAVSASLAGNLTAGTGAKLGLPIALAAVGDVIREEQDGATASAGTIVAAVQTLPSNVTGDVRGTYVTNAAMDGSKAFQLAIITPDPAYLGLAQA